MACSGCAERRRKLAGIVRRVIHPSRRLTQEEIVTEFGEEAAARMRAASRPWPPETAKAKRVNSLPRPWSWPAGIEADGKDD